MTANTGQCASAGRATRSASSSSAQTQHQREAEREDPPAVARVRQVPGRQDQQHERQELRQPDQPEVERVARDLVDLPADRDGLHLHGEGGEEARREEEGEVAIAQDRQARRRIAAHEAAAPADECRSRFTMATNRGSERSLSKSGSCSIHSRLPRPCWTARSSILSASSMSPSTA